MYHLIRFKAASKNTKYEIVNLQMIYSNNSFWKTVTIGPISIVFFLSYISFSGYIRLIALE